MISIADMFKADAKWENLTDLMLPKAASQVPEIRTCNFQNPMGHLKNWFLYMVSIKFYLQSWINGYETY